MRMKAPPKRLTDEQRRLAERYIPLAYKLAHARARSSPKSREELESCALLGLCEAAARFDPTAGVRFDTFAWHCIRGAMCNHARKNRPKGFRYPAEGQQVPWPYSLSAPSGEFAEGCPVPIADAVPAEEMPVGWEVESADTVEVYAKCLPTKYGAAVRLYYLGAGTGGLRTTGAALGLSFMRVSQLLSGAAAMLRERERERLTSGRTADTKQN